MRTRELDDAVLGIGMLCDAEMAMREAGDADRRGLKRSRDSYLDRAARWYTAAGWHDAARTATAMKNDPLDFTA